MITIQQNKGYRRTNSFIGASKKNKNEAEAVMEYNIVLNPLICKSSPPEICSGYYLFNSSFRLFELLI
ncbi:hypothetical protein N665_0116s0038 [Sinapis alba]|nr:hypothetical protein N665_0116s0038 [Sinapis alba]